MGQKVNPIGFRLGIYRDWDARWFARGKKYGPELLEDIKIRKFFEERDLIRKAEIARIVIEKAAGGVRVILYTARPGLLIGKKGQDITDFKKSLGNYINKANVDISVQEIKKPELDAQIIAQSIAAQLERRISFKRAMRKAAMVAIKSGAKGIKVCCSGRLNGAEIARPEWIRVGSLPLHTLRSDLDYGFAEAKTTYGIIGVKVWICRGEYQHVDKA